MSKTIRCKCGRRLTVNHRSHKPACTCGRVIPAVDLTALWASTYDASSYDSGCDSGGSFDGGSCSA